MEWKLRAEVDVPPLPALASLEPIAELLGKWKDWSKEAGSSFRYPTAARTGLPYGTCCFETACRRARTTAKAPSVTYLDILYT